MPASTCSTHQFSSIFIMYHPVQTEQEVQGLPDCKGLVAAQGAAPTMWPPCAGMLDPEVQLVLDTMMRVAFPGHTEFATSKLARELAKQIMEQVKSPRWVQHLDGHRA